MGVATTHDQSRDDTDFKINREPRLESEAVSQSVSRSYRRSAQDAKQGSPVPACARGAWFPSAVNASLVAAECGYSDQAHMIREFSALSGSTPIELVRRYSADGGIVEA